MKEVKRGRGAAKEGQQVTIQELGQTGQVHVHVLDQLKVREVSVLHLNQVNQPEHTHTHKMVQCFRRCCLDKTKTKKLK